MTEIEAKVSYVKLARSLKTYGVSFFLVKVRKMASFLGKSWLQKCGRGFWAEGREHLRATFFL